MAWMRMSGGSAKSAPPFFTIKGIDVSRFNFAKAANNTINFALIDRRIDTVSFGTKLYEDDILTMYTENTSNLGNTYGLKVVFKKKCTVNGDSYAVGSNYRLPMSNSTVVNIISI